MALTPLEDALDYLLKQTPEAPATEDAPLDACLGRVLSADVNAAVDVPPFDNSAMDGYALRAEDSPGTLRVSQRIPAGSAAEALEPGTAARIFTGAILPDGADAVVIQEDVTSGDGTVTLGEAVPAGSNIRRRGADVRAGECVLSQGTVLQPQHLGLAASVGVARLPVHRRLRVAVITTGDELVQPGAKPAAWQIYNSNGVQVRSQVEALGMEVVSVEWLPDDPEAIGQALERAAASADCIISSGGVSVGEEDHVRAQIEARGQLGLWKLALKPGKPLAFGTVSGCPVFGLPGNPVSAWATFGLVVKPWLLKAQGGQVPPAQHVSARADFEVAKPGKRTEFLRVVLVPGMPPTAKLAGDQSSGVLSSVGRANGLAVIPRGATLARGDEVAVMLISEFLSPLAGASQSDIR